LGLSSSTEEDSEELQSSEEYEEALDYIRSMIKTTLPSDGGDASTTSSRYINASSWQRARVQLPRAWLHGVRIEEMNTDDTLSTTAGDGSDGSNNNHIGQVPLQYTLQCSVDDGSKMLEIPLYSIPTSSYNYNNSQSSSIPLQHQQKIDISNEILQEITHNYNIESSASFISLALYHRYNKSGEGSADSPTLKVSTRLLDQLVEMQQDNEKKKDITSPRYCWTLPTNTEEDINTIIPKEGLPLYRSLASIKEEDKRVLGKLEEQNFGKDDITSLASSSSSSFNNSNNNNTTNSSSTYRSTPQGTESSAGIGNVKKSLTLEQQATQEKLKAAWKIALQRQDEGALEKIQLAMEELELEVVSNPTNEEDSEYVEMINELREEQSTLDKIQLAMQESDVSEDVPERDYSGGEDVVGLISDLEEATTASASAAEEESLIEEDDDDK